MSGTILIAEDDLDLQKIVRLYLEQAGFRVLCADNGRQAMDYLTSGGVDLAVLDWMMPLMDGLAVCREIRSLHLPVKVIMLTAKGETSHEIMGLSVGADDYVRKPFEPQVLLLRIKRLCAQEGVIRFRDIALNQDTFEVTLAGERLSLTRTEYELLRCFLRHPRVTLTRQQLLDQVWGMDYLGDARTVDTHIGRLRQKIGPSYIRTRVGLGYVLGE